MLAAYNYGFLEFKIVGFCMENCYNNNCVINCLAVGIISYNVHTRNGKILRKKSFIKYNFKK